MTVDYTGNFVGCLSFLLYVYQACILAYWYFYRFIGRVSPRTLSVFMFLQEAIEPTLSRFFLKIMI